MSVSPELTAMLQRLSRLTRSDREFVLGRLAPDIQARLLALLGRVGQVELSPQLKSSAATARRGDLPAGMTLRAAEALSRAAAAAEANDPPPRPQRASRLEQWRQRLGLGH